MERFSSAATLAQLLPGVPHGTGNPPHTLHSGGGVPRCFQPDINQQ